jgi:hypothetical protein
MFMTPSNFEQIRIDVNILVLRIVLHFWYADQNPPFFAVSRQYSLMETMTATG